MYISDKLIFVELHKTGGSHIGRLLNEIVPGKQVGKHQRVPQSLRNKFILGSVRSPWDWYVSLWAYGCGMKGSVWKQVTRGVDIRYCLRQLPREMGVGHLSLGILLRQMLSDFRKPVQKWHDVYDDVNEPECFRKWLKLMFDPERKYDMGEGYGFSTIPGIGGIYTYRILKLFTSIDNKLYDKNYISHRDQIIEVWEQEKIVNHIIRNESLEDDFMDALAQADIKISDEQNRMIIDGKNKKTNSSIRKPTEYYYDSDSSQLIENHEYIFSKIFGYQSPNLEIDRE